jgi:uncharacterized membrane protein YdbT with pleckstrin-like domain
MEEFQLEPGERVTRTVRTHWFVLLVSLLPFLALALLPLLVPGLLDAIGKLNPESAVSFAAFTPEQPWFRLFLGVWWLFLWIGAFNAFTQYYLNHWVITTLRIVRVRQRGFFYREVSSFLLTRVQDVSTTVDGIFAEIFGYGSVRVQTAGAEVDDFVMDGIDDPQDMRDRIMSQIASLYEERNASHAARM